MLSGHEMGSGTTQGSQKNREDKPDMSICSHVQSVIIGLTTVMPTTHWMYAFDWLSMVLRLRQHNIGYTADSFYRSDDPTNSVKALKEGG